jgi:hypothetical protein
MGVMHGVERRIEVLHSIESSVALSGSELKRGRSLKASLVPTRLRERPTTTRGMTIGSDMHSRNAC